MEKKKPLQKKVLMTSCYLFLFVSIMYCVLNIRAKSVNQSQVHISQTQESKQIINIRDRVIKLSKDFALSFFDGTAFINCETQPVVEDFRQFLRIEREEYFRKGESPLGGSVVKFGDEIFFQEPDQNGYSYAVWIVTTIRTRRGIEKDVVFITRVRFLSNELRIETAGVIPYEKLKTQ